MSALDYGFVVMKAHDDISKVGNKNYVLQRKYDGTRCVVVKNGERIQMIGREKKNDYSPNFPEIVRELRTMHNKFIIDAELTFFDKNVDTFVTALARPETKAGKIARLMVFDVVSVDGKNIMHFPLEKRTEILELLIPDNAKHVKLIETQENTRANFEKIIKDGGEGVVLKLKGSRYVEESREFWVKAKRHTTADCVVVGMTNGKGAREATFGALILAQYDGKDLRYVAKASGFDDNTKAKLFKELSQMPTVKNPSDYDKNDVKKFVPPKKVVEVKFMQKTEYGIMRHPVFLRERPDKLPKECVVE